MYSTQRTVVATVSDKENICRGNDNCKYLIYTDKGVFQNTDTFWYLKYNSSDVYGDIKKGHKYTFKVTGWRWGFWSWYPNVVKTTPAT
jgi:acyl CoA:acetate/3-ketoacid CoA transferase beta subunit